jgi:hypothetical protein
MDKLLGECVQRTLPGRQLVPSCWYYYPTTYLSDTQAHGQPEAFETRNQRPYVLYIADLGSIRGCSQE